MIIAQMSLAEAMAKAREYDKNHEYIPSVSRTLVAEIERLRAVLQKLENLTHDPHQNLNFNDESAAAWAEVRAILAEQP